MKAPDLPGFQPGVASLHRAVDTQPPTDHDFLTIGELELEAGRHISEAKRSRRSYMEGVSTWATMERMVEINRLYLKKPLIAVLEVAALTGIEADHQPATGHHNLYGNRQVMRDSVLNCLSTENDDLQPD